MTPFVDKGAEVQSLVGCVRCKRGFPLDEMHRGEDYPEGDCYLCEECFQMLMKDWHAIRERERA